MYWNNLAINKYFGKFLILIKINESNQWITINQKWPISENQSRKWGNQKVEKREETWKWKKTAERWMAVKKNAARWRNHGIKEKQMWNSE